MLYFEQKLVLVSFGSSRRSYSGAVWSEKCFANHFSPNLKQNRGECGVTLPSGSKISGPQQSLLTEADIFIVERWENVWPTLLFLTECIMQRKVIHVGLNFFCHICRTRMVCQETEILLPWRLCLSGWPCHSFVACQC